MKLEDLDGRHRLLLGAGAWLSVCTDSIQRREEGNDGGRCRGLSNPFNELRSIIQTGFVRAISISPGGSLAKGRQQFQGVLPSPTDDAASIFNQ